MKYFDFIDASNIEQASEEMKNGAVLTAGGTDLIGALKDKILPEYPEKVVSIKGISELDYIKEEDDGIHIGANATLRNISDSDIIKKEASALAEAAYSVATPNIRNTATIGGNICQDIRCWYYRYPNNLGGALDCKRKGGKLCYAIRGENRYHSIFGGENICGSACGSACPAGTDIPKYMSYLRAGDWDSAAKTILKYNPMPMLTSRVCPHLCQDDCNQNQYGESVNVHGIERSLGDYIMEHADEYYCAPEFETGKSVAVIGAGPGGLTAAYYLRKTGHKVTIYDKMEKAGGVLRYGIPHYRLPKDLVDRFSKCLEKMGIEFKMGITVGKDITLDEIRNSADSVYVGTGAWKQPVLGLDGENLTEFGLDFLVEVNTYLEKKTGDEILVCGGGNVAMDVSLTACRLGTKNVRLVCLEQEKDMPASVEEIAMAKEEGVEIFNGWGLSKVLTDENGKVYGLEVKKCLSVFDENHRFNPIYDENEKQVIKSDCIILATGQRVDTDFLGENLASQIKTERGLIDADLESGRTRKEGIYAGGDAVTGPNIAIRAIRSGRISAMSINTDFGTKLSFDKLPEVQKNFDILGVKNGCANALPEKAVDERSLIKEDRASYDSESLKSECNRCMNCGCYAVNSSDIANMLVAYNATVKTNMRTLSASELLASKTRVTDVLKKGEIVTEIVVPKVAEGTVAKYHKYRLRKSIDFAICAVASVYEMDGSKVKKASIVLGACAPVPRHCTVAEKYLEGRELTPEVAKKAAEYALEGAVPMEKNQYKIELAKAMVEDSLNFR